MAKIDLWAFMGGAAAENHVLVGVLGTAAYEVCRSIVDAKGYTRFLKNGTGHYETLWADDRFIYRGLDTSGLAGNRVYAQFEGERYGAVWCDRYLDVGGFTRRDPDIRFYNGQGRQVGSPAPGGTSYLHLRAVLPVWNIPETGKVLRDVAHLAWTFDAEGRHLIEDYYFTRPEKLVGFDYYGQEPFHSRFAGYQSDVPAFRPLPNFDEPTPPPQRPVVVTPPGNRFDAVVLPPNGVNVRETATTKAKIVGTLPKGAAVTVTVPSEAVNANGYSWGSVEAGNVRGWAALRGAWGESFGAAPVLPLFRPRMPFDWDYIITGRFNDARSYGKHEGPDFAPKALHCGGGDYPILAIADGVVEDVRTWQEAVKGGSLLTGYGLYVRVRHETADGVYKSWYGHLAAPAVCEGQTVKAGDVVGTLGTTGNSTGDHVHLTLQHIGKGLKGYVIDDVIDPLPLLLASQA